MYRSLMVPLDGSGFAEHAVPYAVGVARRTGATVHLVRVHVPLFAELSADVPSIATARWSAEQRTAETAYLNAMASRVSATGVQVTADLMEGAVGQSLQASADNYDVDLIVMTTHGRGGFERAWLGSVADLLLRHEDLPILLVRPAEGTREMDVIAPVVFDHVLIPLDESERAERVLPHATEVAGTTDVRYTLLEATWPKLGFGSPYMPDTVELYQEEARRREQEAAAYLADIAGRLRERGATVQHEIVRQRPAGQAILAFAERNDVDLIAMASHGRGGLTRLFLGSVTDKIVRGASVPVLVFPARPARQRSQGEAEHATMAGSPAPDRDEAVVAPG